MAAGSGWSRSGFQAAASGLIEVFVVVWFQLALCRLVCGLGFGFSLLYGFVWFVSSIIMLRACCTPTTDARWNFPLASWAAFVAEAKLVIRFRCLLL